MYVSSALPAQYVHFGANNDRYLSKPGRGIIYTVVNYNNKTYYLYGNKRKQYLNVDRGASNNPERAKLNLLSNWFDDKKTKVD